MIAILDWAEVWALLLPLCMMIIYRKQPAYMRPVKWYVIIALFIDILADFGWKYYEIQQRAQGTFFEWHSPTPGWLVPNNYLYNLHSVVRFTCFSAFFIALKQPFLSRLKRIIPWASLLWLIINFGFFEKFAHPTLISSRLFAIEAGLLLFYCLQYYIYRMQEEQTPRKACDFWVVTGLSIYVVFNFPFFLLYTSLTPTDQMFWWNIHNLSFIILCLFLAKAFYAARD